MTQEDKQLLLKDLCARLPYGVVVVLDEKFGFNKGTRTLVKELLDLYCVEGMKPYLRPISSMTKEETFDYYKSSIELGCIPELPIEPRTLATDWLNAHHFDYRGLIEKGLAIVAPERMYKEEQQ